MATIHWKSNDEMLMDKKNAEARLLKNQLKETDYKIIKSSEYQLLGLNPPYDLKKLHTERQDLRDEINQLEGL